jgi:hypothetical protein
MSKKSPTGTNNNWIAGGAALLSTLVAGLFGTNHSIPSCDNVEYFTVAGTIDHVGFFWGVGW